MSFLRLTNLIEYDALNALHTTLNALLFFYVIYLITEYGYLSLGGMPWPNFFSYEVDNLSRVVNAQCKGFFEKKQLEIQEIFHVDFSLYL